MTDFLFHYTSRVSAQMILSAGTIMASNAPISLSDEFLPSGADAARLLGIPPVGPAIGARLGLAQLTKAIEVVCCIPTQALDPLFLSGPVPAAPFRDFLTRRLIYSGGANEYLYRRDIPVRGLTWLALTAP